MSLVSKAKASVLDYTFDLSADLSSETITSYTTSVDGDVVVDSSTSTGTTVTVVLSGGTDGMQHVYCNAVTTASRTFSNVIAVRVVD